MPACGRRPADLVDGRDHRPAHRERGVTAVGALEGCGGAREQGAAPSAVAPRCAESGDLLLQHHDPERGIALLQVPGGPQAGQAAADDRDVGIRVPGERRRAASSEPLGERVVPEREVPVVASPVIARAPARHARAIAEMRVRTDPAASADQGAPSAAHSCTRSPGSCEVPVQVRLVAVPHLAAVRIGERRKPGGRARDGQRPDTSRQRSSSRRSPRPPAPRP